jgi:hypothetical protein
MARMAGVFASVWGMLVQVVLFWQRVCPQLPSTYERNANKNGLVQRFLGWLTEKKPVDFWYECLKNAQTYEQWEEAAFQLDVLIGNDLWSVSTRTPFDFNSPSTLMLTATNQAPEPYIEVLRLPPHS